jgi:hypothetical protein
MVCCNVVFYGVLCDVLWCGVLWCVLLWCCVVWCQVTSCNKPILRLSALTPAHQQLTLYLLSLAVHKHYFRVTTLATQSVLPLRGSALETEVLPFVETRQFVTVFTAARHLSLVNRLIQFTPSLHISTICILTFFSSSSFQTRNLYAFLCPVCST